MRLSVSWFDAIVCADSLWNMGGGGGSAAGGDLVSWFLFLLLAVPLGAAWAFFSGRRCSLAWKSLVPCQYSRAAIGIIP